LGKDIAVFMLKGICLLYPSVNMERSQKSVENGKSTGPKLADVRTP